MKKNFMKSVLMFMALGAAVFTSCSNDDGVEDSTPQPIRFTAGIDKATTLGTRAAGTTWTPGDKVGIFMVGTGTTTIAEGAANRQYTNTASNSFAAVADADKIYYPVNGSGVDFIAYYPFKAGQTLTATYPVNVANQTSQAAIDLLYSKNATNKTKANTDVAMTFDHKLAKVIIKTVAGDGLTATELKGMTVKIKNLKTSADFDLTTGTLTTGIPVADITPRTKSDGVEYEAIVLPAEFTANNLVMTFTIGGDTFTWKNPTAADGKLDPGTECTYTMTISRTGVGFTCTIKAWTTISRNGTAN